MPLEGEDTQQLTHMQQAIQLAAWVVRGLVINFCQFQLHQLLLLIWSQKFCRPALLFECKGGQKTRQWVDVEKVTDKQPSQTMIVCGVRGVGDVILRNRVWQLLMHFYRDGDALKCRKGCELNQNDCFATNNQKSSECCRTFFGKLNKFSCSRMVKHSDIAQW